jgi:raffinose/stachyose/melibiose transport system substrate-binding protein
MPKRRSWLAITVAGLVVGACGSAVPSTSPSSVASPGTAVSAAPAASTETVTLTFDSWRSDDAKQWTGQIIPAFQGSHPNIKIDYQPTAAAEYDAALNTKLASNSAADLVACRAFDGGLALWKAGYLTDVSTVAGLKNYPDSALTAWRTDDQKTTYCVPMGGSIHGFIYNADIFDKLGLQPPTTQAEFIAVLDKIKQDGHYTPLAIGTKDSWTDGTMGYENIGPNYWKGEDGRQALIAGTAKFTDAQFVDPLKALAAWGPYLPKGSEGVAYEDAQTLFTLGKAAIYPAGSWEIVAFNEQAKFKLGYFKDPLPAAGDQCYVNFHTDIGIGINSKTTHADAAKTFIDWVTTSDFANAYGNAVVGQVPLTNQSGVTLTDPLLAKFVKTTQDCKTTIRLPYQFLSRGTPSTTTEEWNATAAVMQGKVTPEAAATKLQAGLISWYKPPTK